MLSALDLIKSALSERSGGLIGVSIGPHGPRGVAPNEWGAASAASGLASGERSEAQASGERSEAQAS